MPRSRMVALLLAVVLPVASVKAGDVTGRVEMPSLCTPSVSPAVVTLEPIDGAVAVAKGATGARIAKVALVNQRGLQFEPRVQAIQVGATVRFTNEDNESHNVHILTPGVSFNRSMPRGEPADLETTKPGLLRIVCDVHNHMRGFVVVSPTPYYKVCSVEGRFTLANVPAGRYRLVAWHEMGQGASREIDVPATGVLTVPAIVVDAPVPLAVAAGEASAPAPAWSLVIDRVGVKLSAARSMVGKPGGLARARRLIEDAYGDDFEGSEMETAVRRHLGFQRAGDLEGKFRGVRGVARDVASGSAPAAALVDAARDLLLTLVAAGRDLDRLGVTDRTKLGVVEAESGSSRFASAAIKTQLVALSEAFDGVAALADKGAADDASSAMTTAYFDQFEPIEKLLNARRPQDVRPLEARFNAIRGRIGSGWRGIELASALRDLHRDVVQSVERAQAGGSFGVAFFASFGTILREGVEVILLLTMLIALAAKAGRPEALRAIRWGVGLAVAASLVTALGLNLLVSTAQGRAREQIEGWVLMVAAGVLFYVSYWLISQTESKRWTDFLKQRINRGVAAGGFGTLGLTAFLAIYREGAETALMFQGMLAAQGGSKAGLVGVGLGLLLGLAGLAVVYRVIRTTSVKLPMRAFFQVTGVVLFAMAVVFAGNGVFELQSARLLKITPMTWLGSGVPWLGLHPNVQAVSVQGLLVAGAAFALVMSASPFRAATARMPAAARRVERVGV